MHTMIYDSDAFSVFQLDWAREAAGVPEAASNQGGFEIVDKFARKEIFLEGHVADGFRRRVNNLMQSSPSTDDIDEFLDGFSALSRQNL
ncbi:MAG: DUF3567 family protein, partial [Betaproteobacteria bacterium]|nr:DUF3567 family protein [Betaproteobacteria bacterium]